MQARAIVVAALLSAAAGALPAQDLRLPFDGRWFVVQGGDTPNVNHHMSDRSQWYGIDFAKVGGRGGRALAKVDQPARPEDFHSWDQPVLAPAAGEVTTVVDGLPDNPLGTKDLQRPAGNHVVIRIAPGRYAVLAHFRRDSITVRPGDRVTAGQRLGRCGNSGNSDYPHVHLHLQDQPAPGSGRGLNPVFARIDVELTGKRISGVTWPVLRGLFVEAR